MNQCIYFIVIFFWIESINLMLYCLFIIKYGLLNKSKLNLYKFWFFIFNTRHSFFSPQWNRRILYCSHCTSSCLPPGCGTAWSLWRRTLLDHGPASGNSTCWIWKWTQSSMGGLVWWLAGEQGQSWRAGFWSSHWLYSAASYTSHPRHRRTQVNQPCWSRLKPIRPKWVRIVSSSCSLK